MLDQIQPTPLRIFIRSFLLISSACILTLLHVAVVTALFPWATHFWVGWTSAFLYIILFPSAAPNFKE